MTSQITSSINPNKAEHSVHYKSVVGIVFENLFKDTKEDTAT